MHPLLSVDALEAELSRPGAGVLETLGRLDGDIVVLGAGGKMGPSLARMARRGLDAIGAPHRRVYAVSRFSAPDAAARLGAHGVIPIPCDLLDRSAVAALPDAANVIFMAGQKFGTAGAPDVTWAMNTLVPAIAAERYAGARTVVFSTACVYPLVPVRGPGADESAALGPPGDYATSCVGRERIAAFFSRRHGTPLLLFRLSYAIDLRYGVLCDVAGKVWRGEPVDVTMAAANVIWQGDANARAIRCLEHAASPAVPLNVTGVEPVAIRWLAERFAERLGRPAIVTGTEGETAWLVDARRAEALFGPPEVDLDDMIEAQAAWVRDGRPTLGRPTHFEVRDGHF
jgi:nucleoside-diphosphate-sugar epimerase